MTTTSAALLANPRPAEAVARHLAASGEWHRKWAGYTILADDNGNEVHLSDGEDALRVEVCYALSALVETMSLDPGSSVARVARIITAATAPPEED